MGGHRAGEGGEARLSSDLLRRGPWRPMVSSLRRGAGGARAGHQWLPYAWATMKLAVSVFASVSSARR
jgi:hypothetical protein